jgi:hypothetical protein
MSNSFFENILLAYCNLAKHESCVLVTVPHLKFISFNLCFNVASIARFGVSFFYHLPVGVFCGLDSIWNGRLKFTVINFYDSEMAVYVGNRRRGSSTLLPCSELFSASSVLNLFFLEVSVLQFYLMQPIYTHICFLIQLMVGGRRTERKMVIFYI